jgi:hypothetical protein
MQHKRYKRHGFCDSRYSNSHLVQGDAITSREVITVSAPFQLRQTDLELSLEVLISPHFTTAKSLIFPPTARFLREDLRRFVPHFGLLGGFQEHQETRILHTVALNQWDHMFSLRKFQL